MSSNRINGETFFLTKIPVEGGSLEWMTPVEVLDQLEQVIVRAYFCRTPDSGHEFESMPLVAEISLQLTFAQRKEIACKCFSFTHILLLSDSIPEARFDADEIKKYRRLSTI